MSYFEDILGEDTTYQEGTEEVMSDGLAEVFAEAAEVNHKVNKNMGLKLMKVDFYMESAERELNLQLASCELKAMKEEGTESDLSFMEAAAEEGAIGKLKDILDKIVSLWRDFCSTIRDKVVTKICSADARRTLTATEKKIKLNPILKNKKMDVLDIKKPLGVINQYKSKVDKIAAKTVKGIATETTRTTLMQTKDKFREDFKRSITGNAAMVAMTIGAIVAALNAEIEKLPSYVASVEKENTLILEKLKATVTPEAAAAATAATQAAANFRTELAKEELNQHIDHAMSMMDALRKGVKSAKGNTEVKAGQMIKESAEDDFDYLADDDETYVESAEDGYLSELDAILGELEV